MKSKAKEKFKVKVLSNGSVLHVYKTPPTDDYGNTPAQRRKLVMAGKCVKHRKRKCKKC